MAEGITPSFECVNASPKLIGNLCLAAPSHSTRCSGICHTDGLGSCWMCSFFNYSSLQWAVEHKYQCAFQQEEKSCSNYVPKCRALEQSNGSTALSPCPMTLGCAAEYQKARDESSQDSVAVGFPAKPAILSYLVPLFPDAGAKSEFCNCHLDLLCFLPKELV